MTENHTRNLLLIILDGWGVDPEPGGNAIKLANTPYLDELEKTFPSTTLACSGKAVGLPEGFMGNSEVGHLNMGAGRVVYQELLRIDMAIEDGSFFENQTFQKIMETVKEKGSALHLIGLVSDGGVHSHIRHLYALLDMAKNMGIDKVFVHAIMDGRDTSPTSGKGFIKDLQSHIRKQDFGRIASICGRFYAMDRDTRWERIEKAYRLYTLGEGVAESDPVQAMENAYLREETDEFIKPVVMMENGAPVATMENDDAVIFFNFRADRAREITKALTETDFPHFSRERFPGLAGFVTMTRYDEDFPLPVAFAPSHLTNILGEVISNAGLKQFRIAETEKYAHVTYFFNGGEETPFPGEDRLLVPSPRDIPTYDHKPEMSAFQVKEEVIPRIRKQEYSLIVLNFANMDMVGHTGILEAAIKACEAVDTCLSEIICEVQKTGGTALITADHGNAERMTQPDGSPMTAHTLNPVPFYLVDDKRKDAALRSGIIGDIAPTILHLLGIPRPEEMTGKCLIK